MWSKVLQCSDQINNVYSKLWTNIISSFSFIETFETIPIRVVSCNEYSLKILTVSWQDDRLIYFYVVVLTCISDNCITIADSIYHIHRRTGWNRKEKCVKRDTVQQMIIIFAYFGGYCIVWSFHLNLASSLHLFVLTFVFFQ